MRDDPVREGGRLPPQNVEAERGVLAGVILDPGQLPDVRAILPGPDRFFRESHRAIYRAVLALDDAGNPVDLVTLDAELRRAGDFAAAGGDDEIFGILGSVPHVANTVYHAQIVRAKAMVRDTIETLEASLRDCYADTHAAEDVVERARQRLDGIAAASQVAGAVSVGDLIPAVYDRVEARQRGQSTGLPSGFVDLDATTNGFQPEELVVIAGRPSMGKSSYAMNILENVSIEAGVPSLFVSLEMGNLDLAERVLASRSRVNSLKLRGGMALEPEDRRRMSAAIDRIVGAPLYLVERPSQNVLRVVAEVRCLVKRLGVGLVAIDYLQLIDGDNPRQNRQEVVADTTRRLKRLARELQIPVIVLSQLNRALESRDDKRPRMSDLRESGAIEQDADIILMLHRPEYFDHSDSPGVAEVGVAKNRNGMVGDFRLTFVKECMRFENHALAGQRAEAEGRDREEAAF